MLLQVTRCLDLFLGGGVIFVFFLGMMPIKYVAMPIQTHPDAPLIEDYRAGDQICSECGLVVGDRFVTLILSVHSISLS